MDNESNHPIAFYSGHVARGFTLLELMISLSLASAMIFGFIMFYAAIKTSSVNIQESRSLIESGRFVTEMLNSSVRMARYWGCTGEKDINAVVHLIESPTPASVPGMYMQGIYGEDAVGPYGSADAITVFQVVDSTETTIVGIDDPLQLAANPDPLSATAVISVAENSGFSSGDFVAINDCTQGDIVQLSSVTVSPGSPDELEIAACSKCFHAYTVPGSLIQRVNRIRYSVRNNSVNRPALYIQENGNDAEELVDGVEDMQIYYGQDLDGSGDVDRYVLPSVINKQCDDDGNSDCWRRVANVRISVLLRTIDDGVVDEPQQYQFDGTDYTATDRRFRRDFTTIVAIRNHRL